MDSALFLDGDNFDLGFPDISNIQLSATGGNTVCNGSTVTLTVNGSTEFIYNWYHDGSLIPDAASNELIITSPGTYSVQVTSAPECTIQLDINIQGSPTADVTDYVIYEENTDGIAQFDLSLKANEIIAQLTGNYTVEFYLTIADATNNTNAIAVNFTNLSTPQTIYAKITSPDTYCNTIVDFQLKVLDNSDIVPPPTGDTTQTFTTGDTLADVEVDGENILWYDTDGTVTGPPTGMGTPLALTTVLEDGTTYYASQTINDIESVERLPVTVNFVAGLTDIAFSGLQYYPNPVKDVITFSNTSNIDNIAIVNITGQTILSKNVDNTTAQIDLSGLSEGIYFAKIASDGKTKTIKIIKE
jgi:hypothetical protein